MAAKSIKEIALGIGVEVTSAVEEGNFRARNVYKRIGNLAETFVWGLETDGLAAIVGANPDLLERRIPIDSWESYKDALKESLRRALIEECVGYRDSAEAFIIRGKVIDSMRKFMERLREMADRGVLSSHTVDNMSVFVDRIVERRVLDDIDRDLLKPIVTQMGVNALRLRNRFCAATGISPDQMQDPLLDTIDDLSFLVERSQQVLLNEIEEELRELEPERHLMC
jgi:hypothetical protein